MLTAIIATTTALAVAVLTYRLSALQAKQQTARETTMRYLNPLRFYVAENLVRFYWIHKELRKHHRRDDLRKVLRAEEVSSKPREWFNWEGYYLATTCYFTARLFSCLADVRREIPYFKLRRGRDTDLLARIRSVNVAFAKVAEDFGIPYVTQDSIGADVSDGQRKLSYHEFCELLMAPERRVWCDRLIYFYLELGDGGHEEQQAKVCKSLYALSQFLDDAVRGGESLKAIVGSEQISWRDFTDFIL